MELVTYFSVKVTKWLPRLAFARVFCRFVKFREYYLCALFFLVLCLLKCWVYEFRFGRIFNLRYRRSFFAIGRFCDTGRCLVIFSVVLCNFSVYKKATALFLWVRSQRLVSLNLPVICIIFKSQHKCWTSRFPLIDLIDLSVERLFYFVFLAPIINFSWQVLSQTLLIE